MNADEQTRLEQALAELADNDEVEADGAMLALERLSRGLTSSGHRPSTDEADPLTIYRNAAASILQINAPERDDAADRHLAAWLRVYVAMLETFIVDVEHGSLHNVSNLADVRAMAAFEAGLAEGQARARALTLELVAEAEKRGKRHE